jgi:hypothetical protein
MRRAEVKCYAQTAYETPRSQVGGVTPVVTPARYATLGEKGASVGKSAKGSKQRPEAYRADLVSHASPAFAWINTSSPPTREGDGGFPESALGTDPSPVNSSALITSSPSAEP